MAHIKYRTKGIEKQPVKLILEVQLLNYKPKPRNMHYHAGLYQGAFAETFLFVSGKRKTTNNSI